jgi:hypothetical protein
MSGPGVIFKRCGCRDANRRRPFFHASRVNASASSPSSQADFGFSP